MQNCRCRCSTVGSEVMGITRERLRQLQFSATGTPSKAPEKASVPVLSCAKGVDVLWCLLQILGALGLPAWGLWSGAPWDQQKLTRSVAAWISLGSWTGLRDSANLTGTFQSQPQSHQNFSKPTPISPELFTRQHQSHRNFSRESTNLTGTYPNLTGT